MSNFPCNKTKEFVENNFPMNECEKCDHETLKDGLCTCDLLYEEDSNEGTK